MPYGLNPIGALSKFTAVAPPPVSTILRRWNGSTWVAVQVKMWNGSAWVDVTLKRYNGTGFN